MARALKPGEHPTQAEISYINSKVASNAPDYNRGTAAEWYGNVIMTLFAPFIEWAPGTGNNICPGSSFCDSPGAVEIARITARFQWVNNLKIDGKIGPQTIGAIKGQKVSGAGKSSGSGSGTSQRQQPLVSSIAGGLNIFPSWLMFGGVAIAGIGLLLVLGLWRKKK